VSLVYGGGLLEFIAAEILCRDGGLPYNEKAVASGAQTERRGGAGPLGGSLGGKAPTGCL